MLTPQEAYEILKRAYPEVTCFAVEASFPDKQYYRFHDHIIDATQLEYLVDKDTGEVVELDDMIEILARENAVIDALPDPEDFVEHRRKRAEIVQLIQPEGQA